MERICVGDLHGNINLYHEIKTKFPDHLVTIVGDLLDSFVYTRAEQTALLELVLNDIERGTTECVLGNHDLSYLYAGRFRCPGFEPEYYAQLIPHHIRMRKLMKPYILDEEHNILITHAGLSESFLNNTIEDKSISEIDLFIYLQNALRNIHNDIYYEGGIFWCRPTEFTPIKDLRQIFGHTHVLEIRNYDGNYNIDCLETSREVLEITEDGKITTINF